LKGKVHHLLVVSMEKKRGDPVKGGNMPVDVKGKVGFLDSPFVL